MLRGDRKSLGKEKTGFLDPRLPFKKRSEGGPFSLFFHFVGPKELREGYIKVNMKKARFLLLPLLSLTLLSCGSTPTFSNADDPKLPYIDQNGESLLRKDATKNTIDDLTWPSGASSIIADLRAYEYVCLFYHGRNCSHCLAFEPTFDGFALDSLAYVYGVASDDEPNLMAELSAAFPTSNFASVLKASTPTLYFLAPSGTASAVDLSQATSTNAFENEMASLMNRTSIVHFKTYAAYSKWAETNSGLYAIESKSNSASATFYQDHVRANGRHENKAVAAIDWDSVSSSDQASFALTLSFSLTDPYQVGTTKIGGSSATSYSVISQADSALSAVRDYFNA